MAVKNGERIWELSVKMNGRGQSDHYVIKLWFGKKKCKHLSHFQWNYDVNNREAGRPAGSYDLKQATHFIFYTCTLLTELI